MVKAEPLNKSKVLSMAEITNQLFNNQYLSDLEFHIDDKIIYAHSFELMKRSVEFERQLLPTLGVRKAIPIVNYKYEDFYQLIRFIYTDECVISDSNITDILRLAIGYKVPKLENEVIRFVSGYNKSIKLKLKVFDFCVSDNYGLLHNWSRDFIAAKLPIILDSEHFLQIQPKVLGEILKFDEVGLTGQTIKETQIYDALVKWMNHYCQENQLEVTERRNRFDSLIKLIRFPTMTQTEFNDCAQNHPGILSDNDFRSIFKQMSEGSKCKDKIWNGKARKTFNWNAEYKKFTGAVTKFRVKEDLILTGLWYGNAKDSRNIELIIKVQNSPTCSVSSVTKLYSYNSKAYLHDTIISLGESLRFEPGCQYTLEVILKDQAPDDEIFSRTGKREVLVKNHSRSVQIVESSCNMFQMFFKKQDASAVGPSNN